LQMGNKFYHNLMPTPQAFRMLFNGASL